MIKLRPYQEQLINEARAKMQKGHKNVLLQLATGGGKTAIASFMIKTAYERGFECWFVCNRQELVDQTARSLYKVGIPFGYIAAGYMTDERKSVHVCSIQTLNRRLASIRKPPEMIFWDETRGIAAKTWSNVYHNYPNAFHIGLDATPCRLSGEPLSAYYSTIVKGPTVRWLIDNGFLCDYKIFAPKVASFENVHTRMGDYVAKEIDDIMNQKKILGNAVKEYIKHANGKRNLVFCNSIAHSKNLREEFQAHGIAAEDIDGNMNDIARKAVLKRFETGETKVLTSVELVTAGYNLPSIECVTLERPTQSISLAKQMIGRGLRPSEGKERLLILDHVNMWQSHGLPDDEIDWSLDGTKRPKKLKEKSVKMCEKCYFVFDSFRRECPECGHAKEIQTRQVDIEHTDDELAELNIEQARLSKRKEQGQAQTKEELYELGISRGYEPHKARRWAHYVFQGRQKRKLRGL